MPRVAAVVMTVAARCWLPGHDSDPAWAPGRKIAFTTKRDGNFEIYVMNADGSGQRNVTHNPAVDRFPIWSPGRRQG